MRVLITGGAGFIGTNLANHLVQRGTYQVVVLDNLLTHQQQPRFLSPVRFVHGDFTNRAIMAECLQNIDAVVHLAALSGVIDSVEDPRPSFELNVVGSFQLLSLARAARVACFINASTGGALLGESAVPISEAMAPNPLSPYGASKLAIEGYCSAFSAAYGLPCLTLRFSNIYGPSSGHKRSAVATFIKNIIRQEPLVVYGDGSQKRDFLYVGDLVRGIEAALVRHSPGTYQLGFGQATELRTLAATLRKVSGRTFSIRYERHRSGEVHSTWCDISKARRELGYAPTTDLEDGLRQTWAWYLENQDAWDRQSAQPPDADS
jgi:UDP-glucose 4-epimerase